MAWERRRYRGHKVWTEVDDGGAPRVDARGLAAIRYREDDPRTYSVRPEEIRPLGETPPEPVRAWVATSEDASGVAVVLGWRDRRREVARRIAPGSPRHAALVGLVTVLRALRREDVEVRVHAPQAAWLRALAHGRGDRALPAAVARAIASVGALVILPPDASPEQARAAGLAGAVARGGPPGGSTETGEPHGHPA